MAIWAFRETLSARPWVAADSDDSLYNSLAGKIKEVLGEKMRKQPIGSKAKRPPGLKFSEESDYLAWGLSYSRGDYQEALNSLNKCLAKLSRSNAARHQSFLLGVIAHTLLCLGDKLSALRSFRLAECRSPQSLLVAAAYVKFLHDDLKDFELAVAEARRIIRNTKQGMMHTSTRMVFQDNLSKIEALLKSSKDKLADK
jgi:tetratricopeptide (TPR) repeat protein